jgi:hypothetical protein
VANEPASSGIEEPNADPLDTECVGGVAGDELEPVIASVRALERDPSQS